MQSLLPNCNWIVVFVIVIISVANVAANREIPKASNGLRKGGSYDCSPAWPDHSSVAQGNITFSFQILLKVITPCAEERSGWSCLASPFFPADRTVHSKTRRTIAKEMSTQSIPCCKDWISKVCCSAWNMATLSHIKQTPLNWIMW